MHPGGVTIKSCTVAAIRASKNNIELWKILTDYESMKVCIYIYIRLAGFVDRLIKSGMHTVTRRYKIIPGILHMRHILNYGICFYGDYNEKRKQI